MLMAISWNMQNRKTEFVNTNCGNLQCGQAVLVGLAL